MPNSRATLGVTRVLLLGNQAFRCVVTVSEKPSRYTSAMGIFAGQTDMTMAPAMAPAMTPAMRLPMAEGIGGSNGQAKPSHYVGWLGLWFLVVPSQNQVQSVTREIGFGR
jgi:hypothetical protein